MMKKIFALAFAGICLFLFVAGPVMAEGVPSAKFAATWTQELGLESVVVITDANVDTVLVDADTAYTLATIKVPQDKELLVGISAEIGLVTDTSVKGKNGGTATSLADAAGYVTVFAVPRAGGNSIMAEPGQITLSKRIQALTATLGGVIQSCSVSCFQDTQDSDADGNTTEIICEDIVIAEDCVVTDEQIGLLQDTTAAHHFNFVLPNMNQGVYDIKAVFATGARAKIDICDEGEPCSFDPDGTVSGSAYAKALINKTMLTVQQVRAAKGGLIDADIVAP
jgi:hypothetical protein